LEPNLGWQLPRSLKVMSECPEHEAHRSKDWDSNHEGEKDHDVLLS